MQEVQTARARARMLAVCVANMSRTRVRRFALRVAAALMCLFAGVAWASTATYYYDELGRLIETVAVDGTSVQYSYDAVGNITSVKHDAATTVGISGFIPVSGPVGTSVSIFGSGFNTTAASNVVKFNGVAATVTAATATTLTVKVPTGATTGTVSVANGAASATSSGNFTVASSGAPTITSFTPTIAAGGATVTIAGTNFQTNTTTDKVLFSTVAAPVSTATATSISTLVPGQPASGKLSVTTPFGVATSTADFFDVPTGFNVADVQFTGRVALAGAPLVATTTVAGKIGLILFDGVGGTTGAYLQLTNVTSSGGGVSVFSPNGSLMATGVVANGLIGLPKLSMTGTYVIVLAPSTPTSLSLSLNQAATLTVDGAAVSVTSVGPGYGAYLTFSATAGQNLGLGLSGLAFTGGSFGSVSLNVIEPDGSTWPISASCNTNAPGGDCGLSLANLPLTGNYVVQVVNGSGAITNATFTLSSDKTGTLIAGTASALSLRSGQNGRLAFAGMAGQPATIRFENVTTTPANQTVPVSIWNPDGTQLTGWVLGSTSSNGGVVYVASLPTTGAYTVRTNPWYGAPATMSVTWNPAPELVVDGATVSVTTAAPNYGTSLSFTATAGQNLGLGLTGLTFTGGSFGNDTLSVIEPNGTTWPTTTTCLNGNPNGGCNLLLGSLPLTGTYLIQLSNGYAAITNATFTLSSDKTGTLAAGTPSVLSLRSGQAGRLTFAGTAGQPATIRFENVTTTPANQTVPVSIWNPDGTQLTGWVTGSSSSNGGVVYVASLPTTGAYTVRTTPWYGVPSTMSVTWNPASELVVNGASVTVTTAAAGYGTSLSFNATAGQNLGLGLSGLTFTGGTFGNDTLSVIEPNGTTWPTTTTCLNGNPNGACNMLLGNLPLTGTYLVELSNSYAAITNATFTLSSDETAALTAGTPAALNLRSGQNGRLTFAGTAGQPATIRFENMTSTPANQTAGVSIWNPDGTQLTGWVTGSSSSNGGVIYVASLPTSGTYTVQASPWYGTPTTMSVTWNPAPELVVNGAAVTVTTAAPGYGTSLSFSATAGQNLGLGLSGLTFTGGTFGNDTLSVIEPNGTTWPTTTTCLNGNPNGDCNLLLGNLPLTGTYLIELSNSYAAITNATFTLSSDETAALTAGTPAALNLRSGQNGRLTFAGTAGQPATIRFENMTSTPANQTAGVSIWNPDGTQLTGWVTGSSSSNGGVIYVASLPTSGTYTVQASPWYGTPTTMSVTWNPAPELVVNGAAVAVTTAAPGYGTSLSFSATAGQNLGLGLSGLTFTGGTFGNDTLSVIEPNGTTWPTTTTCLNGNPNGDCNLLLGNLPLTGTYLVQLSNSYAAITNATFTLSSDKAATLTAGIPSSVSLRAGQNGRLTFTGTAASHSLTVGIPATTPSGQTVAVTVVDSSGNAVASGSYITAGGVLALGTLSAETYTVLIDTQFGAATTVTLTYQ